MTISEKLPHITVQPDFPIDIAAIRKGQPARSFWLSKYGSEEGGVLHGNVKVSLHPESHDGINEVLVDGGREFNGISLVDNV